MRVGHGAFAAASGAGAAGGKAGRKTFKVDGMSRMNCFEFEEVLTEILHGSLADPAATAHVEACTRCRQRLASQQKLSTGLAEIRSEDSARGASADTERMLLAEFRKGYAVPRHRSWTAWAAAGAVAAGVVLAGGLWFGEAGGPRGPPGGGLW